MFTAISQGKLRHRPASRAPTHWQKVRLRGFEAAAESCGGAYLTEAFWVQKRYPQGAAADGGIVPESCQKHRGMHGIKAGALEKP